MLPKLRVSNIKNICFTCSSAAHYDKKKNKHVQYVFAFHSNLEIENDEDNLF